MIEINARIFTLAPYKNVTYRPHFNYLSHFIDRFEI